MQIKKLLIALTLLSIVILLAACGEKAPVAFEEESLHIRINENVQLAYSTANKDAKVLFRSSNPDVVTVNESGTVHGIQIGNATVIASVGEYEKAYIEIYVDPDTMDSILNVSLNCASLELIHDLSYSFSATVKSNGEAVSDASLLWSSSDESVATVKDGKVKALLPGKATITVQASVGDETAEASCPLTVYEYYKVDVAEKSIQATIGSAFNLTVSVFDKDGKPVEVSEGDLTWITSDPSAIAINGDTFKVISVGAPSVGAVYKGNITSIPVEIFSITADFFKNSATNFYGEVDGVTFSGVQIKSSVYQPYFYFNSDGIEQLKAYASKYGYTTITIHNYPILFDNSYVINGVYGKRNQWNESSFSIDTIDEDFYFWSQSQGTTEIYMWFELS